MHLGENTVRTIAMDGKLPPKDRHTNGTGKLIRNSSPLLCNVMQVLRVSSVVPRSSTPEAPLWFPSDPNVLVES